MTIGEQVLKKNASEKETVLNRNILSKTIQAGCIAAMVSVPAVADQGAGTSAPRASQVLIENIVVTARKKSAGESAQDVPATLTAVSGDQLEAAFITDLTQLGNVMPNVNLDEAAFPGIANYTIRGMGFNSTIASAEPTVGTFVDGVYLGVNHGSNLGLFDLESVEVLRGPQGTLFGRNVTAGAVVMRSRRPDGEFAGVVRMGLGSGGRQLIGGGVEGSLTDTLAGKIYAEFNARDGDFYNIHTRKDIGEEDSVFVRQIFAWRPTSTVDVTTILEHGKVDGEYGMLGRTLNDPTTHFYDLGAREPKGADKLELNTPGSTDLEWNQFTVEANWDIGPGTMTSVTGYRDVDYVSDGDGDGSAIDVAYGFVSVEQEQFSQELRYAGQLFNDRLDYVVGAYYFEQKLDNIYETIFYGSALQRPRGKIDHRTYSLFANGDYELAPEVYLTAGLRYDREKKDAEIARGVANCDADFNCFYDFVDSENWSSLTPKLGISWKPSADTLLYASWSKGFRSGGYNSRATAADEIPGPYDEEEVEAVEIGFKGDFFDGRARVNAALFHNRYSDLQRVISDDNLNFSIRNAASATIEGAELELTFLPVDSLVLQASVGYQDATYDSFPGLDVDGDGAPDPHLAKGLQLIRAPEWTYSASATYDHSLGDAGSLVGRVSYIYTDDTPMNDANRYTLDAYELVDASLTWSSVDGKLSASLWGKNLTNEIYGLSGTTSSTFTFIFQSLPRTYGAEVVYRF